MANLKPGDVVTGFTINSVRELPEYRSLGIGATHIRTGCRLYHLKNDDRENLFAFAFKTPPDNNTGVPHIIEHSILSGSRRFPVKDPFAQLLKGSMYTFLNAMTYPDRTIYPASSTVEKDFFNLMLVYGDAVFFPLLRKEIFFQEGCHFLVKDSGQLEISGVVYNEMRGNYSSHEAIVGEWSLRSLFPDSIYRFDSGGDPYSIPELTYEDFLSFHRTYYHPSNCFIFLYGDIPTENHLEFLEGNFLSTFEKKEVDISIPSQPRWDKPRYLEKTYPPSNENDVSAKSSITLNWLTLSTMEQLNTITMEMLSEALLGNPGAPLHKTLVESGLGEDLSPASGLEAAIKEMVFTVGLRGTDPEKVSSLEDLVFSELTNLIKDGIPSDVIEGAIRRVEFRNKELRGGVPNGLRLLGRCIRGWMYNNNPESTLEFSKWMEAIKEKAGREKRFFEELLERELALNPHRSTVVVRPDSDYERKEEEKRKDYIEKIRHKLGISGILEVKKENQAFESFQKTPDKAEDLRKIPFLKLKDAPQNVEIIHTEYTEEFGIPLYTHDFFTNKIVYIDFAFDTRGVGGELSKLLPLYAKAVKSSGLPDIPYDELARQLALKTGGFYSFLEASSFYPGSVKVYSDEYREYIFFRLKCLEDTLPQALRLVQSIFTECRFDDKRRIKDLLLELRNDFRASLIPRGNAFATLRAASKIAGVLARMESWRGITQLLNLWELSAEREALLQTVEKIREKLRLLLQTLFTRNRLSINITAEESIFSTVLTELSPLVGSLPVGEDTSYSKLKPEKVMEEGGTIEPIVIPSSVGYAATSLPASFFGTEEYSHEGVLAHLLKTDVLWDLIRMRGGAYGVSASVNGSEGIFSLSSYRDPEVFQTINVFKEAVGSIASGKTDRESVDKAILGVIAKEIKPLVPGSKGFVGFRRKLLGITDESRQKNRDYVLQTKPASLKEAAERIVNSWESSASVILGGEKLIKKVTPATGKIKKVLRLPL